LCRHWFGYPEPNILDLDRYYREIYSPRRKSYFGEEYYVFMERRAKAQSRFIEESLSRCAIPINMQQWRIMDWGCGIGALVAEFQHRGSDVIGYDSDLEAIEIGQKRWTANITLSSSHDLDVCHGLIDLLLLSHVIEHFSNIRQTLQDLIQVLKPGRFVFIEVPNCSSDMFNVPADHESHLNFFSSQSLIRLLENLGVQVITCLSCGPPREQTIPKQQSSPNYDSSPLMVRGMNFLQKLTSIRMRDKHIRTIYDGFYDHYSPDENGMWLRCLARI
jgi:2-polyprenyl-3-methyl-5-hydroxy-6-metoxy-1,4-benzoquinol methylase